MQKAEQEQKSPVIVFDLGGVLINWNPLNLYRKMFVGQEEEMDYFLREVCPPEWNGRLDGGLPFADGVAERIALYPAYAPYIEAFQTRWIEMIEGQIEGTVAVLAALRAQGYLIFALTNWSAETYPLVSDQFEFLHWFEDIVISGVEKMIKPDRAIYDLLLERVGHPAEDCLFIDDSEPNIVAAQALGFQTVHFSAPEQLAAELGEKIGFSMGG